MLSKEVNEWTQDEKNTIEEYALRDVKITKDLYIWIENYFKSFRDYVSEEDINSKKYLTCSTAVFTYKSVCKAMGWKEEYSNQKSAGSYGGGYVAYPAGKEFHGNIYCLDFSSLYPSIMHQCGIFSMKSTGWSGGKLFKTDGIYNDKEQGKTEQLIKKMYEDRIRFKKTNDPRQYSLKIQINACYGLLGSPPFLHLYNKTAASDVTKLGRQWIKYARNKFFEAGYNVIYTDTDSVYIVDHINNKDKILEIKSNIINDIKSSVPFPYNGFDMSIDAEISDIYFYKGEVKDKATDSEMDEYDKINKPKGFLKKNYIYVTKSGKVKVKNLGVVKKSLSALSRKLFNDVIIEKIKNDKVGTFSEHFIKSAAYNLLEKDLDLSAIRFNIKPFNSYKLESQMQAQISKLHGNGIKFMIPVIKDIFEGNKLITVGKDKKYILLDDFKRLKISIDKIDLSRVWAELNYFIKSPQSTLAAFS